MPNLPRVMLFATLFVVAMTGVALAQSEITGVVQDTSGAILPGASVEAVSPALMGSRTVVTDARGRYRIADLRPGVYQLTISMPGFNTAVRDGIDLPASFTSTVNVQLEVSGIEETITVTGESPVVDVKRTTAQSVMDDEIRTTIPTGRDPFAFGQLIPGVTTSSPDVGGTKGMQQPTLEVHGSDSHDGVYQQDGMTMQHVFGTGNQTGFYYNDADMQEIVYSTSAATADKAYGGVTINMVTKEGGNTFHGAVFATGATDALQSNNESQDLYDRGLQEGGGNKIDNVYDLNLSLGGPIMQDKLWFFGTFRRWGVNNLVANTFNLDGSQALDDNRLTNWAVRLSWQINRNNKLMGVYNKGYKWRGHRRANLPAGTQYVEPEATVEQTNPRNYITQLKWTSWFSDELLVEAGVGMMPVDYNLEYQDSVTPTDLAKLDLITGVLWNAAPWNTLVNGTMRTYMASASIVTGNHNLKTGFQARTGWLEQNYTINGDILQRYRNGVPDSVINYNTPLSPRENTEVDLGIYLQDSWSFGRFTLNPGVRFDMLNFGIPAQGGGGGRWTERQEYQAQPGLVSWKSIVPRFGMSWDIFGDGRTALKGSISKFMRQEGVSFVGQVNPNGRSGDTRSWNDLNGDDIAQENELGPSGGFAGGATTRIDPDVKRPYQWEWSVIVDHELRPGLAVSVGYFGRRFYNLYTTANLAVTPQDYTPVTIENPLDGSPLTVYNQDPDTWGLQDSVVSTLSSLYTRYHGVELKMTHRLDKGQYFMGFTVGENKGTEVADISNPNYSTNAVGNIGYDSTYQLRAGGAYMLPADIQLSGAWRVATGLPLYRNYTVGRNQVPDLNAGHAEGVGGATW